MTLQLYFLKRLTFVDKLLLTLKSDAILFPIQELTTFCKVREKVWVKNEHCTLSIATKYKPNKYRGLNKSRAVKSIRKYGQVQLQSMQAKNAGKQVTGAWQRRDHTESPVKNKKPSKRCKYISVMENEGTMSLVAGKHVIRSKHQEKQITDQLLAKRKLSGYTGYRGRIHVTSRKRGKHDDNAREKISQKERLCPVYKEN